jgi:hypothetical protein
LLAGAGNMMDRAGLDIESIKRIALT